VEVVENGGKLSNLAQMEPLKKLLEEVLMFLQPTLEETLEVTLVTQVTLVTLVTPVTLVTLVTLEALKVN
jgi:hypothetical protein